MRKEDALEDFLESHEPIACGASLASGTLLAGWRIVAFLGRGGSAEVYRVVHLSLPLQGALKILIRNEASHVERFRRETELLAKLRHPAFPRFLGSGEVEGRPYIIMELLEPMELPHDDKAVAKFLVSVAEGVKALHSRGIIHRDIKPQNIMRRADGSPVIIDLGLAKRYSPLSRLKMPATLSVVDGKRVGLGTPRYAAPEQFSGGEISPAADIHALGMLADECFGGKAPLCWMRIIRRCSSSIPFLRYQSADDFIRAVRRRHWLRNMLWSGLVLVALVLVALFTMPKPVAIEEQPSIPVPVEEPSLPVVEEPQPLPVVEEATLSPIVEEPPSAIDDAISIWRGLASNVATNIIERELVSKTVTTNYLGLVSNIERVYSNVTKRVDATIVRLNNATHVFDSPITLLPDHECWIEGPGILDAELLAPTGTVIRLRNCVFLNRTRSALDEAKLYYSLEGGTYMNFSELSQPYGWRQYVYIDDGATNKVRFHGPETIDGLMKDMDRDFNMSIRDM